MLIFSTKSELRSWVKSQKADGKSVGFVPTMGALHQGHQALMKLAVENSDVVVVSVFVNPTQFGPNEDFSKYPRTLDADIEKAKEVGVKAVFAPSPDEMYQSSQYIHFQLNDLNAHLCGKSRPGHFEGVIQVVNKLFNIVQPDIAFFGKKDIQQCIILKTMVDELDIPVQLHFGDTIRERDGLALSSRNRYLSENQRKIAPDFYNTLNSILRDLKKGVDFSELLNSAINHLNTSGFRVDYIELVNESDLQPVSMINSGKPYILAGAVFLGTTRLIDNIQFTL